MRRDIETGSDGCGQLLLVFFSLTLPRYGSLPNAGQVIQASNLSSVRVDTCFSRLQVVQGVCFACDRVRRDGGRGLPYGRLVLRLTEPCCPFSCP